MITSSAQIISTPGTGGGSGSTPRLDQVLNPTSPKTFTLGANALTFTGSGGQTYADSGTAGITISATNTTGAVNIADHGTSGAINITDVQGAGIFIQAQSVTQGLIQISITNSNNPEITLNNSGITLTNAQSGGTTITDTGSTGILIQSLQTGASTRGVTIESEDNFGVFLLSHKVSAGAGGIYLQDESTTGITLDLSQNGGSGPLTIHTNATGGLKVQRAAGSLLTGQNATESSSVTSITVTEGLVTAITGTSDERLKTNIQPFQRGLAAILAISPKTYQWNEKGQSITNFSPALVQAGFIAQDVQKAIPEAIGQEGDYLSLDTRAILAALVNAVKELSARIDVLEARC